MKLSEGIESAIHCAVMMAALEEGAVLPAKALAEYHGVSESYLLKQLQALSRAGIIESVPGPSGGYRLARSPAEITLLDFVDAIEGTEPAFRCQEIRQRGPIAAACAGRDAQAYARPCAINAAMLRAETVYRQALRRETLQLIIASLPRNISPEKWRLAQDWLGANQRPVRGASVG